MKQDEGHFQQVGQKPVEQLPEEQVFVSLFLEEEAPRLKEESSFFIRELPQAGHWSSFSWATTPTSTSNLL